MSHLDQVMDTSAVDAAANAFYETISKFAEFSSGAHYRHSDTGTRLLFTGLPAASLNMVCVGAKPDLGKVDSYANELSTRDVPWSIQLRGDADSALLDLAGRYGKTSSHSYPLLVWDADLLASLPASVPKGLMVREVLGTEHETFSSILASGFGMAKDLADGLSRPTLLDASETSAFVLEFNGEAVGTGLDIATGNYVGMYNGTVAPEHRRRGYYRALVAARLRIAVASGARYAVTQNSPMSRPLFEALGFRFAETWTYLTSE